MGIFDPWEEDQVSWINCFGKGGGYIQFVIQLYENDFFTNYYGENNKWYYHIISVKYFKAIVFPFCLKMYLIVLQQSLVSHI